LDTGFIIASQVALGWRNANFIKKTEDLRGIENINKKGDN